MVFSKESTSCCESRYSNLWRIFKVIQCSQEGEGPGARWVRNCLYSRMNSSLFVLRNTYVYHLEINIRSNYFIVTKQQIDWSLLKLALNKIKNTFATILVGLVHVMVGWVWSNCFTVRPNGQFQPFVGRDGDCIAAMIKYRSDANFAKSNLTDCTSRASGIIPHIAMLNHYLKKS